MKAVRIPVFVLAVLLAFSVCNAVHLTRRCALWQAELRAAMSMVAETQQISAKNIL